MRVENAIKQTATRDSFLLGDSGSNFVLISRANGLFILAEVVVDDVSVVAAAAVVIAAAAAAAAWSFKVAVV